MDRNVNSIYSVIILYTIEHQGGKKSLQLGKFIIFDYEDGKSLR